MTEHEQRTPVRRTSRFPDPLVLIVGLGALFASAYVITDGNMGFPSVEPRWAIAAAVVFCGVLLLLSSVRGKRR